MASLSILKAAFAPLVSSCVLVAVVSIESKTAPHRTSPLQTTTTLHNKNYTTPHNNHPTLFNNHTTPHNKHTTQACILGAQANAWCAPTASTAQLLETSAPTTRCLSALPAGKSFMVFCVEGMCSYVLLA